MKAFYHDLFTFPLPQDHRFPISKYALLRQRILDEGILPPQNLILAQASSPEQLKLVHTPDYIQRVIDGRLDAKEIRRIGFPWSPELVERSRRSVGSTIAACRAALQEGIAANLAGGTHHAYPDHGEGFCVFNDVAVASRQIQHERLVQHILVIDCDVHQGNGTAYIFRDDPSVFTFSIHGEKNFPFHKETGDLDIALPDGANDPVYLSALDLGLENALHLANAGLAIYLAGADPFVNDRLGRMALTKQGLAQRDRKVLEACLQHRIPVAVVMAGGYASQIEDIVDIHCQTIRISAEFAPTLARSLLLREHPE